MAEYTKQVTISPSAAQAAGCSATCVGTGQETLTSYIQYDATATAVAGWSFDHWEYRVRYTDTVYPERNYVDPPYGTDPDRSGINPERFFEWFGYNDDQLVYSSTVIDLTAVFVSVPYRVSAFRFNDNLDGYVTLNGDTDRLIVSKDLEAGAAVDIMFSSPDPTVVFQGWYRLAPGDPVAGGVLVSTNPHYTTTVRTDGANRYRARLKSTLVMVQVYGGYDGSVSINGENDGTDIVIRNVPIGVPCILSAEPVIQSGFSAMIFLRWLEFSEEEHQYVEVSRDTSYTFTPDGTKQNYNFSTEWARADSLTVFADPQSRGSVSRSPEPEVGDKWYSEDTLNSPGVTLTATPRPSAKFLYWCYISSSGRDIIESREPVTTVHYAHDYIARFGPSDLLVNTYNRATPVGLVHDPATNLLVADYKRFVHA